MRPMRSATRRRGGRSASSRRARGTTTRDAHGRFVGRGRSTRSRRTMRPLRARRARSRHVGRRITLPRRDALGRFIPNDALVEIEPAVGAAIVRQASRLSRPERRVVKRRWWRAEGPQNPELPRGYAYEDEI